MKTHHRNVKITKKLLEDLHACGDGLDAIASYLPLTISTDPEQNLGVAILIATSPRAEEEQWHDARWFAYVASGYEPVTCPDHDHWITCQRGCKDFSIDPYVVAQHLAMAADFLLVRGIVR